MKIRTMTNAELAKLEALGRQLLAISPDLVLQLISEVTYLRRLTESQIEELGSGAIERIKLRAQLAEAREIIGFYAHPEHHEEIDQASEIGCKASAYLEKYDL